VKNVRGESTAMLMTIFLPAMPVGRTATAGDFTSSIFANIAFLSYGGLHLLAWRYHFRSTAESILWKMAAVLTSSSGVVPLVLVYTVFALKIGYLALGLSMYAWNIANMAARTYLFVESFVALPNSPPSTYQVPQWTSYIPHI
jgi:hypothetical protein